MATQRVTKKADPKLFLVHYGFYVPGEIWEQHGAAHVVAPSAKEARPKFKALPWVKKMAKVHIDGIIEVQVEGYNIRVEAGKTRHAPPEQLGYSA